LTLTVGVVLAATSAAGTGAARAQDPDVLVALQRTQTAVEHLAPEVPSETASFAIDDCTVIYVQITSSGGALTTSITGPNSEILDPQTIANFGGEYGDFEGTDEPDSFMIMPASAPGYHHVYVFPALGPGSYVVSFAGSGLTQDVAVITQVTTDSPVAAALFMTDAILVQGKYSVVVAAVYENSTPVVGATVTVNLMPPAGDVIPLVLLDDGLNADDTVGDGLYSAVFQANEVGQYTAMAEITGTTSMGHSFLRHVAAQLEVVVPTATFDSTLLGDAGVDTNGNGLYEFLAITAPVTVFVAGEYALHVTLETALGQTLQGHGTASLPVGSTTVSAQISAEDITNINEDAPYTITQAELVLWSESGAMPTDLVQDGSQPTQAWLVASFEHPAIQLTGVNSDAGIDSNGNGLFDQLRVDLGVLVTDTRVYIYDVRLVGPCGEHLQFAYGTQYLTGGAVESLTLTFNGTLIGQRGIDGPYYVRDVVIYSDSPYGGLSSSLACDTQSYMAADFEGYMPQPDCNDNDTPDSCDIYHGTSLDCNVSGVPDECEPECWEDCNQNGKSDCCDIGSGLSDDCNENDVPDECEPECWWADCNQNGVRDCCDIHAGTSEDCQGDGVPDECQPGCPCLGWVEQFPDGYLGLDGRVLAMTVWDRDGAGPQPPVLMVGGELRHAGGLDVNYIAQWDGLDWQPLGSGMGGSYPYVQALSVYNGDLIAGGGFTTAGGVPCNRIARWNGSTWHPLGSGMNGDVYALRVYNGELIAGGWFTTAGGVSCLYIARWDGAVWQPLGSGMNSGAVTALTAHNGDLIAGGGFTTAGGVPCNRIARWNGSTWQPLGSGMNGYVYALRVYNGELIAGGSFTTAGGVTCNYIACWNGSTWQPVGSGTNDALRALAVFNGELIAGGDFMSASGGPCDRIARWDGSAWHPLGSGMNNCVRALTVYPEADCAPHLPALFAGGQFVTSGGLPARHIARWNDAAPPRVTQPDDQAVEACGTPSFAVDACGCGPLEYQWYRDSTPLFDGPTGYGSVISGATTPTLVIADARAADAGDYRVRVWHCGSVISDAATLTMTSLTLPGDVDDDCDVDLADFGTFAVCLLGAGVGYPPGCGAADLDSDDDVDLTDYQLFFANFSGPSGGEGYLLMGGGSLPEGEPRVLLPPQGPLCTEADLTFEVRRPNRRAAVRVLAPYTTYELHCRADTDAVNQYMLAAFTDTGADAFSDAAPASTGAWAATGHFQAVDIPEDYRPQLEGDDDLPPHFYLAHVLSDEVTEGYAGPQAPLCTFTTGPAGRVHLDLRMYLCDPDTGQYVCLRAHRSFVVTE